MASIRLALRDLLQDCIHDWIGASEKIKKMFRDSLAEKQGTCFNDADEFALSAIEIVDDVLQQWKEVQATAIEFRDKGYDVLNLTEFGFEIDALQALRDNFSNNWPWLGSWKPPFDKEMAERSRVAYESGECETIDDLLNR